MGDVYDAKSAVAQPNSGLDKNSRAVWTSVSEHVTHSLNDDAISLRGRA